MAPHVSLHWHLVHSISLRVEVHQLVYALVVRVPRCREVVTAYAFRHTTYCFVQNWVSTTKGVSLLFL